MAHLQNQSFTKKEIQQMLKTIDQILTYVQRTKYLKSLSSLDCKILRNETKLISQENYSMALKEDKA